MWLRLHYVQIPLGFYMLIVVCAKWRKKTVHLRKLKKEEAHFEELQQNTGDSGYTWDMDFFKKIDTICHKEACNNDCSKL